LSWFFFLSGSDDGSKNQIQHAGGVLASPGWTGDDPLFLPKARMQPSLVTHALISLTHSRAVEGAGPYK
jgi:hypothetical protein